MKKITATLLAFVFLLSFAACGKKDKQETLRDTEAEKTFRAVLNTYYEAISEKQSAAAMTESGVNYLVSYLNAEQDALKTVRYAFLDLDADGQKELLIFNNEEKENGTASVILDLYGVYDGKVTSMLQSTDMDCYYMGENNIIYCESSTGDGNAIWEKNTYEYGMLNTVGAITCFAPEGESEKSTWTYSENEQPAESIPEERAMELVNSFTFSYLALNGTPFSEWKK